MIEYVEQGRSQELDAYVINHPNCHFMQSSYWGKVKREWQWYGMVCRNNQGKIIGSMSLLCHKQRVGGSCLLYAPRGPIVDTMEAFKELAEAAQNLAKQLKAYVLRIDPLVPEGDVKFKKAAEELQFQINCAEDYSLFQPRMCYVLNLKGMDKERLLAQYHASTRRNVRHAEKKEVKIRLGGINDLPVFCEMMREVGEKNGFSPRMEGYFRDFLKGMGRYAKLYLATVEERTIGGMIVVTMGNRTWLMYSCSRQDSLQNRPNELLEYKAQCDAIEEGCLYYDFRGVEGYPEEGNPHYGLHLFKQGFGAEFRAYLGQMDYIARPLLAKAVPLYARLRNCGITKR